MVSITSLFCDVDDFCNEFEPKLKIKKRSVSESQRFH